ncbi:hypothetical protein TNCV_2859681 [Trichonephila clavipes]|nr:hypothetical protein TNCV_2859681 [Trichonephila clavipes]
MAALGCSDDPADGNGWSCLPIRQRKNASQAQIRAQLVKTPRGSQEPPTSLPLPPTSREDLRLDGYLEHSHAVKALYKHQCLLRDSNPGPTAPRQRH